MRRIIWHDPITGGLNITTPAYNDGTRFQVDDQGVVTKRTTDAEFLMQVRAKVVPAGVQSWLIDDEAPGVAAFLRDRSQRNAWTHTNGVLRVGP